MPASCKTILFLPLDERPCNIAFPVMNMEGIEGYQLLSPPPNLLGCKKDCANVEAILDWLEAAWEKADAAVISLEMLVFGGLLPSRIHALDPAIALDRLHRLEALARRRPELPLYLFGLVMRCPAYDSDDEEPRYWAHYGAAIHRLGALRHKRSSDALGGGEAAELAELETKVPAAILEDYLHRRDFNLELLRAALAGVAEGWIDLLAIPQDDTAPWGWSTMDRDRVLERSEELGLGSRVPVYPGADEAGCSLTARALNAIRDRSPEADLLFADPTGFAVVPQYENQEVGLSLDAHLGVAGLRIARRIDLSRDVWRPDPQGGPVPRPVLALNLPRGATREAPATVEAACEPGAAKAIELLLDGIEAALAAGSRVYLADLRFTNGGDRLLVQRLAARGLLERLSFYSGWNTVCNALGTVVGAATTGVDSRRALRYRVLEDWGYMTGARPLLGHGEFPPIDDHSPAAEDRRRTLAGRAVAKITEDLDRELGGAFGEVAGRLEASFPWSRRFEIAFHVRDEER